MMTTQLRSGFAWLLSGNVLYSACQLGIVWILARMGTVEQVGEYALGMAVAAPLLMFGDFQLRALIASDVEGRYSFAHYLSFRVLWIGLAVLTIAGTAVFTQSRSHVALVIIVVGLAQSLEFLSDTYYGIMQREERLDRLSRSLLIKGPCALAAMTITFYLTKNVLWAILALGAARLAVFLAWDSRVGFVHHKTTSRFAWQWPQLRSLFHLALPLGVVSMLASVNSNVPRYFLESDWGSKGLGLYSPVASLLTAGSLVISAMGQTLFVPVAQSFAVGDRSRFRSYIFQAVALAGTLGACGILLASAFGQPLLSAIFGRDYREQSTLLLALTCAGAISFLVSALGYIITAARSLRPQIPLMLGALIATSASSALLIPRYGPEGAAAALGVSAGVQLLGTVWILFRLDRSMSSERRAPMLARSAEGAVR